MSRLTVQWVLVHRYCELTGETAETVRHKCNTGLWTEGREYRTAADGQLWVDLKAVAAWVEQKQWLDVKKPPRGVQIRKNAHSTSLRISFTYQGVECRERLDMPATPANIRWAAALRDKIRTQIRRGTFDYHKEFPNSKMAKRLFGTPHQTDNRTVKEMLEAYFEQSCRHLKQSSKTSYVENATARIYPAIGHLRLRDLTPAVMRQMISKMGKSLKIKTIKNTLTPLRHVLDEAVTDEIIPANPLDKVNVLHLVDRKTGASNIGADPLDYEEIRALLSAPQREQERNWWQFAIFTGLQTGEQIALRWSDVDWLKKRARIERAVVAGIEDTPKTKARYRWVDLNRPALWALQQQKAFTFIAGGHIFHDPLHHQPWHDDMALRTRWVSLCRRAKGRYRKPYVTRQTFCSQMLSQGKNPLYVAKQMGHTNMKMIIRHYGAWVENGVETPGRPFDEWTEFCADNRPAGQGIKSA